MPRLTAARRVQAACMALAVATLVAGCSTHPRITLPELEAPAPAPAPATAPTPAPETAPGVELGRGKASWYGPGFQGKRTASGERFDMNALTAAHRTLAFGTRVLVRNVRNGREVVVRINDRGPHVRGRIIDLSKAAAAEIDLIEAGEALVVLIEL